MFLTKNKKNNVYPCKPKFYYTEVGFKGVKIIYIDEMELDSAADGSTSQIPTPSPLSREKCKNNVALTHIYHAGKSCSKFG